MRGPQRNAEEPTVAEDNRPDTVYRWVDHPAEVEHLVKGVTYHRLRFDAGEGRFAATVVLDV